MKEKKKSKSVQLIQQLKKDKFVEIYNQTFGHISDTCRAVGIDRGTYYNWLESDEKFLKKIMESEMELNDDIRDVLVRKAGEGDMTAVIFYLKKRHPDFKEQPQPFIQSDKTIIFQIVKKDDKTDRTSPDSV